MNVVGRIELPALEVTGALMATLPISLQLSFCPSVHLGFIDKSYLCERLDCEKGGWI